MTSSFGRLFRVSLFGESHGPGVGVLLDGVPPGLPVSEATLQTDLDARRPGQGRLVSQRKEADVPRVLSGIHRGRSTGAPLAVWIENRDVQSKAYLDLARTPRPSHADWPALVATSGHADLRGGGHASGRLTAGLVVAGTVARGLLEPMGIRCAAHLHQVGPHRGPDGKVSVAAMLRFARSPLKTAHASLAARFEAEVEAARRSKDSVGGAVEFRAEGLPAGLGDPWMDGLESTLAHLLFAVPAVKGVSFGAGMGAAAMRGSAHNDPYAVRAGRVVPSSNHAGGLLGGRTSGAPLWGHVAVKPASSIAQAQRTVDLERMRGATLEMTGRHDPCIAIRAVPVARACLEIGLADALLVARANGLERAFPPRGRGRPAGSLKRR